MWSFSADKVQTFAYIPNMFTPTECHDIIDVANTLPKVEGYTGTYEKNLDTKARKNKIAWLRPGIHLSSEYCNKLAEAIMQLNNEHFNFDIWGLTGDVQFTEYSEYEDHYTLHTDKMYDGVVRKLSAIVQLSPPENYTGCELELHVQDTPIIMPKYQGTLIVFPSYILHKITPLIKGTRHSLVAWIGGPQFK